MSNGGRPKSYATTYSNGGGSVSFAWIGLRRRFFQDGRFGKVDTILHELRHAVHLGTLAHPENFDSNEEMKAWVIGGGQIETQGAFERGVQSNCIGPLKSKLKGR